MLIQRSRYEQRKKKTSETCERTHYSAYTTRSNTTAATPVGAVERHVYVVYVDVNHTKDTVAVSLLLSFLLRRLFFRCGSEAHRAKKAITSLCALQCLALCYRHAHVRYASPSTCVYCPFSKRGAQPTPAAVTTRQ